MDKDLDEYETIPIYLSKPLLYIFEYSLESTALDLKNGLQIEKCKFKPEHQEVLMENSLEIDNPNYDIDKGEHIVINCDGHNLSKLNTKKNEDNYFNGNLMDKIILKGNGNKKINSTGNMAIGFLNNEALHICPLQGIIKINSSIDYLDKSEKRSETKDNVNSDEEEEEVKQVTVKFARQENERSKMAREKSFGYLSKKNAEEPWYNMEFINPSFDRIELERQKLYYTKKSVEVSGFCVDSPEFLQVFIPNDGAEDTLTTIPTPIDSSQNSKQLSLVDQLKHILRSSTIINFERLIEILGPSYKRDDIVRAVQHVAVLVQGNWAVQSDLLYPKNSTSKVKGISAAHMINARDYMIYQFTQQRTVIRNEICEAVKLPSEEVIEILKEFAEATNNNNNQWELILPRDENFMNRYSQVTSRQNSLWEAKYNQLLLSLGSNNSSGQQRRKSHRDSSLSSDDVNNSPIRKPSKKKLIKKGTKSET